MTPTPTRAPTPGAPGEPELIARVLAGERSAFRPLVEAHEPAVHALCCRLLGGDAAEAEDVGQEVFLRAYRRLAELEDPRRFASWLLAIARSLCRERRRRLGVERRALAARRQLELARAAGEPAPDPGEEVRAGLDGLPEAERRALELRYLEGLPYREVATRLGMSFSRADHLIRKARSRLAHRVAAGRPYGERTL